jgi:hypothetical protein
MIVGDEHGLTDGVLLAEIVLLLKEKKTNDVKLTGSSFFYLIFE